MTPPISLNSFGVKIITKFNDREVSLFSLPSLSRHGICEPDRVPYSIRVLWEAALRNEDGHLITREDVERLLRYNPQDPEKVEVPFLPARVLLQDFTGVPCVVDLAAMRSAMARLGGDPQLINPLLPVDLVIDHSIQVDYYGSPEAAQLNMELEFKRNAERYRFLKWGSRAFNNFRVIPPGSGICHQINLEYLAKVVQARSIEGETILFPDSLVGTDSHTTMINGLSVVGWGVGGIEAEAVMLGQPLYFLMPEVVGVKLIGELNPEATATDLVLTLTQILRRKGVVDKFVEFFGPGVETLSVPDRATLSNMAPEYGATMGFFPPDQRTLEYLSQTGRSQELVARVEWYLKEQGLFRTSTSPTPQFKDVVELDLSTIQAVLSGPKRPQDRVPLPQMKENFYFALTSPLGPQSFGIPQEEKDKKVEVNLNGSTHQLSHGDVLIAAITSCTNTSNPSVMLAAGILARKAVEKGLKVPPYVKTSLSPGSLVVTDYLKRAGLLPYLEQLGFHLVGYGCMTCIGNSGPLPQSLVEGIKKGGIVAAAVLSGNRNFTGRIHPQVKAAYLASPPLVIAFALAGTVTRDLTQEPVGYTPQGKPVFLKELWPTPEELKQALQHAIDSELFRSRYEAIEQSNQLWNQIEVDPSPLYQWDEASTYIQEPPFFQHLSPIPEEIKAIENARILVMAGDSITTDHISPAGNIHPESPAGRYLIERGVPPEDFNQYGARRGNDRVMTRGTFANVQFRNLLGQGRDGWWTTHFPSGELMTIYDAAVRYRDENVPLLVIAGQDYGMGSSRDWAAKGTHLLGIKAVLAQSFERIHRSNLIGMGVLPLQFLPGENAQTWGISGNETFHIFLDENLKPHQEIPITVTNPRGETQNHTVICRLDNQVEIEYYRNGGILNAVLRKFLGH